MTPLLLCLSALNFAVAALTGNLASAAVGSALLLLATVWACGEAGEVEYDADEA
jgi:ABC-type multidrug transport system permease subunit